MNAGAAKHVEGIWTAVDAIIDRAPSLEDLREHRLQLLAERRWSQTGKEIPPHLVAEKKPAAALVLLCRACSPASARRGAGRW